MTGPVMIVAGGTGGHVFPGLAVAAELEKRAQAVVWLGTREGIEASAVPAAGIEAEWIQVSGLRGRGLAALPGALVRLARSIVQAIAIMRRRKPRAVLGFGGFVSAPGGLAAWLCRRRLLIHEQNAIPGTANRLLSKVADGVFETFENSFPPAARAQWVGNPVRDALCRVDEPRERYATNRRGHATVLVLGGSQGARALNEKLPHLLAQLPAEERPRVVHQGGRSAELARSAYRSAGVDAEVIEFIDDMAAAYARADLVICRAGATTLSELAAVGVASVLVPFPYAIDDHQRRNAEHFVHAGAAKLVSEDELDVNPTQRMIRDLLADRGRLREMAQAARQLARPDAAAVLADACLEARP